MKIPVLLFIALGILQAQTTVTLNGVNYTMRDHPRVLLDGSVGILTGLMSNTSTGRPIAANPFYGFLQSNWTNYGAPASVHNCPPAVGNLCLNSMVFGDGATETGNPQIQALWTAELWMANGSNPSDTTYLPTAQWAVNHIEDFLGGSFGCDEIYGSACGGRSSMGDFGRSFVVALAQTYSIIRSTLTSGQRQAFADKMLNDNDTSHNGLGGTSSDLTKGCHNQGLTNGTGTITISGTAITFSSAILDSSWVGAVILGDGSAPLGSISRNFYYARIASVTDSTHAVASKNEPDPGLSPLVGGAITGFSFRYSKQWVQDTGDGIGNCGMWWWFNHVPDSIHWTDPQAQSTNWTTDYPPDGGSVAAFVPSPIVVGSPNNFLISINNKTYTEVMGAMSVAMALADDDVRARNFLTEIYNVYYLLMEPGAKSVYTAFGQSGAQYTTARVHPYMAQVALMLKNNLLAGSAPGATATAGVYLERQIPYYLYLPLDADPRSTIFDWGGAIGPAVGDLNFPITQAAYLYPSDPDLAYTLWLQKNVIGIANDTNLMAYNYMFYDGLATQTNPTGAASLQYLFRDNDYALCTGNTDWSGRCYAGTPASKFMSLTGFGTNDTRVLASGGTDSANVNDHDSAIEQGAFNIFKKDRLLWFDNSNDIGYIAARQSNTIELGSESNWRGPNGNTFAATTRWAGANPHGPSSNSYTYGMLDNNPSGTVGSYLGAANATRVQRHVWHAKKSGAQDYIIAYDDVAVSAAETIKAHWNYWLTASGQWTDFSADTTARTAQVVHASAGPYATGNTEILSKFLPVAGSNSLALILDNSNGSPTPATSNAIAARATACASSDGATCSASLSSFEELSIHMPVVSTSASMPTITQPAVTATGGNATAVQIADATTPKVAVFARQGALLSQVNFTSTHSGTAQYCVFGLAAGTYLASVASTPVTGSPFTVSVGDYSLCFENTAGAVVIGPGCVITPPTAGPYTQGTAISTWTLTASNCGPGTLTWSCSALPTGLSNAGCNGTTGTTSTVTGTPSAAGTFTPTISVTDGGSNSASVNPTVVINPPSGGGVGVGVGGSVAAGGNVVF